LLTDETDWLLIPCQLHITLNDHDLGISLVDNMPQEVTYITLHAPVVKFRTTKHTQSLRIAVGMYGWPSARVCGRRIVF
jgi:hypothetical protein